MKTVLLVAVFSMLLVLSQGYSVADESSLEMMRVRRGAPMDFADNFDERQRIQALEDAGDEDEIMAIMEELYK